MARKMVVKWQQLAMREQASLSLSHVPVMKRVQVTRMAEALVW